MADYFINLIGTGSGIGSEVDPFATVAELLASAFTTGDTAYFNRGDTFPIAATLVKAGIGITYDAYGAGADPIIDGEGSVAKTLELTSTGQTAKNLHLKNATSTVVGTASGTRTDTTFENLEISSNVDNSDCMSLTGTGAGLAIINVTINQPAHITEANTYGLSMVSAFASPTINGLTINGNQAYAGQYAIRFTNVTGTVTLTDVTVTNWGGTAASAFVLLSNTAIDIDNLTISGSDGKCGIAGAVAATMVNSSLSGCHIGMSISGGATFTCEDSSITGSTEQGILIDASTAIIRDCTVTGNGLTNASANIAHITSGNSALVNCTCTGSVTGNGVSLGGTGAHTAINCDTSSNFKDGFESADSATVTITGGTSNSNGDVSDGTTGDGYTSHGSSHLNLNGCYADANLKTAAGLAGATTATINNCTFINSTGSPSASTDINVTSTASPITIQNCIVGGGDKVVTLSAASETAGITVTLSGNVYSTNDFSWNGNAYSTLVDYKVGIAGSTAMTETSTLNEDPLLDSSGVPTIISPCVGAAPDEPGAAAWIVGANGEVFPNVNRDIGGNQSTHSPTHPVNT